MRILTINEKSVYDLPYTYPASGGGVDGRALPFFTGRVDALPGELSGLLIASDLQGVASSNDQDGALALLGEVLAEELRGLEERDLIPPRQRLGVLLAGDLFAAPAGDKRGATGDVRLVWDAFAREVQWVAGVAGNHDLFGSERERERFASQPGIHLLDGQVVDLEGLRVGGVGGIIGNTQKPGRRDAQTFLELVERVVAQQPEILILHEGPDEPSTRSRGNADVRDVLCAAPSELLVFCGHSPWTQLLATLKTGCQVLNVAEKAVLLTTS